MVTGGGGASTPACCAGCSACTPGSVEFGPFWHFCHDTEAIVFREVPKGPSLPQPNLCPPHLPSQVSAAPPSPGRLRAACSPSGYFGMDVL